jgi:hypothetical protein
MTMRWSLTKLMKGLHDKVAQDLQVARETLGHPVALGDGSQTVWISMFAKYLPERYRATSATIVDGNGRFSEQIDVVIFDRQYSPLIFEHKRQLVIPAEAVYAVFESKQEITRPHIQYAQKKVASVRRLQRTSAEVQTIDGPRKKVPQAIIGGFLAFETRWKKPIEKTLARALSADQGDGRLDLGCVVAYGTFGCTGMECQKSAPHAQASTCFLLELITRLQSVGTVPAIDMRAYAKWLG